LSRKSARGRTALVKGSTYKREKENFQEARYNDAHVDSLKGKCEKKKPGLAIIEYTHRTTKQTLHDTRKINTD